MKLDITGEIEFRTARSGGKGGQNVNKVETMVEVRWNIETSTLISDEQKAVLNEKLSRRLIAGHTLLVKSQVERSQLANKQHVIKKLHQLLHKALEKKKSRIATKTPKAVIERQKEYKKQHSDKKSSRKKINLSGY